MWRTKEKDRDSESLCCNPPAETKSHFDILYNLLVSFLYLFNCLVAIDYDIEHIVDLKLQEVVPLISLHKHDNILENVS